MGACAKPSPPVEEPIELSLNLFCPEVNPQWTDSVGPWCNEIEARSDGKVKIVPYFACALSSMADNYDSVISGIADMGFNLTNACPERFPMFDVMSFPNVGTVCNNPGYIHWQLYEKFPELQAAFSETHLLFLTSCTWIGMVAAKPILSLEDIKGLKMHASPGWMAKRAGAMGASVSTMPIPDVYMSLQRGVIDGSECTYILLLCNKYGEQVKHFTEANLFGYTPFYLVMNKDKWDSLPADIQKIFSDVSKDYAERMGDEANWRLNEDAKKVAIETFDLQIHQLTPGEAAKFMEVVKPVRDEFIADLEAKGLPGEQLMEEWERLQDKYALPH